MKFDSVQPPAAVQGFFNRDFRDSRSVALLLLLVFSFGLPASAKVDPLADGFCAPPSEAHPLAWWHWINGNVTKAGISADLADMRRVGIAGVQMFDVSMNVPPGPAHYGSDLWFGDVQHAIREANRLGLEFSMQNSPGWSASGGPWVTPAQSMKQLVWTETETEGGRRIATTLPQPFTRLGFYRDIAALAVPDDGPEADLLRTPHLVRAVTEGSSGSASLEALYDRNPATSVTFGPGGAVLVFEFDQTVPVSQLTVSLAKPSGRISLRGSLEGSFDGMTFTKLDTFAFEDHEGVPAQFIVPFKRAQARFVRFRLEIISDGRPAGFALSELALGAPSRLDNWTAKIGLKSSQLFRRRPGAESRSPAIRQSQIIDITKGLGADGTLHCDLPPGEWTILRFGFTTTGSTNHHAVPEGHGLEIDKLDPDAVAFCFHQALGRVIRQAGSLAGKTFKGVLFDSFEAGPQNWTASFPRQFQRLEGYDIRRYLPVLTGRVVGSPALSECVLFDFRAAIKEMFARDYFGTMQRLAHEHGMKIYAEAYGGHLDPMLCNQYVDVPMEEFWLPDAASRAARIKLVTSVAHILGKPIIASEAFTAQPEEGRWNAVPSTFKNAGDYAYTLGVNRFALHDYTAQPVSYDAPGFTLGRFGSQFGRLNTWWHDAGAWIGYLSRCQFLLQQGRSVNDVCFLLDEDIGYKHFPARLVAIPAGYDFDISCPQFLGMMKVRRGMIVTSGGARYRLLVLPRTAWVASVATLRSLRDLVKAGATVLGDPPVAPAGALDFLKHRAEFDRLIEELWGDLDGRRVQQKKMGRGTLYRGLGLAIVLKKMGVEPDFAWSPSVPPHDLRFIHRRISGADIYFVFNHDAHPLVSTVTFRVALRRPELWNPLTGSITPAPVFDVSGNRIELPLQLEAYGSMFIVFRHALPKRWAVSANTGNGYELHSGLISPNLKLAGGQLLFKGGEPVTIRYSDGSSRVIPAEAPRHEFLLKGPWQVSFLDGRGAPPNVTFPTLVSWTENTDSGIKYYSGTAAYRIRFNLPSPFVAAPGALILDLGKVADLAKVEINGHSAGIWWQPPFRGDVTRWLHVGSNTLEVQVTNEWVNRLIGDQNTPVPYTYSPFGNKFTGGALQQLPSWLYHPAKLAKRKRYTFTIWRHYTANSPLVPSGLLGPVKIEWREAVDP